STGSPTGFRADVMAVAKKDLRAGEILDGEGGYTVVGQLAPAETSLKLGALPLGLAHGLKMKNPKRAGQAVTWDDVDFDSNAIAIKVRRDMESEYR
ncbi:MAG: SAF domain-containing protein, partial [Burkholderiales bacterium]|nr:SAF domain-containing protein [Burkholderiales bacterium]